MKKNQVSGNFWDKNHTWLSVNKVENMLVTTGAFWEQILRLWHIFGVKSHLGVWAFVSHFRIKFALDNRPKVGKNAQYYIRVLRKNVCGSFWDQNHNWLSNKKVEKMLDIIFAFWEKNGGGGGSWKNARCYKCLFFFVGGVGE